MAGVEGRAQQQESGKDIWAMVNFSGPFQASVDRIWVPRDKRKLLKTLFPCHYLQPSPSSQALLQSCFHSLPLYSGQLTWPMPRGRWARRQGQTKSAPTSCTLRLWAEGHTWERERAPLSDPSFRPVLGPELHPGR